VHSGNVLCQKSSGVCTIAAGAAACRRGVWIRPTRPERHSRNGAHRMRAAIEAQGCSFAGRSAIFRRFPRSIPRRCSPYQRIVLERAPMPAPSRARDVTSARGERGSWLQIGSPRRSVSTMRASRRASGGQPASGARPGGTAESVPRAAAERASPFACRGKRMRRIRRRPLRRVNSWNSAPVAVSGQLPFGYAASRTRLMNEARPRPRPAPRRGSQ